MTHLTKEQYKSLHSLANRLTMRSPNLSILKDGYEYPSIASIIEGQLKLRDKRKALLLPELLQDNETVAIFSDYGGEAKESGFHTYSFLVCAWNQLDPFHQQMSMLREEYGLNNPLKEISFKDFQYGPIQRSLDKYLTILNNFVQGLLATIVVDKKVKTMFGDNPNSAQSYLRRILKEHGFGDWKPRVSEKLFRVIHATAYLVALLSREGQKVLWMTDDDAIAPNLQKSEGMLKLFSSVLSYYSPHNFNSVGGAKPFQDKDPMFLDLLRSPDLVAGSIEHYYSRSRQMQELTIYEEADRVLRWLAHDGICLKKFNIIIQNAANNQLEAGTLNFELKQRNPDVVMVPVDLD
jgi:hypothetical protein